VTGSGDHDKETVFHERRGISCLAEILKRDSASWS
jgi:hypothetical protein